MDLENVPVPALVFGDVAATRLATIAGGALALATPPSVLSLAGLSAVGQGEVLRHLHQIGGHLATAATNNPSLLAQLGERLRPMHNALPPILLTRDYGEPARWRAGTYRIVNEFGDAPLNDEMVEATTILRWVIGSLGLTPWLVFQTLYQEGGFPLPESWDWSAAYHDYVELFYRPLMAAFWLPPAITQLGADEHLEWFTDMLHDRTFVTKPAYDVVHTQVLPKLTSFLPEWLTAGNAANFIVGLLPEGLARSYGLVTDDTTADEISAAFVGARDNIRAAQAMQPIQKIQTRLFLEQFGG